MLKGSTTPHCCKQQNHQKRVNTWQNLKGITHRRSDTEHEKTRPLQHLGDKTILQLLQRAYLCSATPCRGSPVQTMYQVSLSRHDYLGSDKLVRAPNTLKIDTTSVPYCSLLDVQQQATFDFLSFFFTGKLRVLHKFSIAPLTNGSRFLFFYFSTLESKQLATR